MNKLDILKHFGYTEVSCIGDTNKYYYKNYPNYFILIHLLPENQFLFKFVTYKGEFFLENKVSLIKSYSYLKALEEASLNINYYI
jgi:hypothetical protein